eukprot:CAMPEP_0202358912 /NCGR_PEP_ID=MMETSP1126-20121109/12402_1 /ASSEMBLY_ACC=CAM_ASM_000457 /TAXON_ID=3047 /ORGANISM="Dunaliella tertiolecta, Strain CCMP1320" /LENGTH=37 /DNA_ID= /DNA_START= /DNA_END= /DNA_ORIENTATION=
MNWSSENAANQNCTFLYATAVDAELVIPSDEMMKPIA